MSYAHTCKAVWVRVSSCVITGILSVTLHNSSLRGNVTLQDRGARKEGGREGGAWGRAGHPRHPKASREVRSALTG